MARRWPAVTVNTPAARIAQTHMLLTASACRACCSAPDCTSRHLHRPNAFVLRNTAALLPSRNMMVYARLCCLRRADLREGERRILGRLREDVSIGERNERCARKILRRAVRQQLRAYSSSLEVRWWPACPVLRRIARQSGLAEIAMMRTPCLSECAMRCACGASDHCHRVCRAANARRCWRTERPGAAGCMGVPGRSAQRTWQSEPTMVLCTGCTTHGETHAIEFAEIACGIHVKSLKRLRPVEGNRAAVRGHDQ